MLFVLFCGYLFCVRWWHKPGVMVGVASVPHDVDFVDSYITVFAVVVAQVQHARFHLQHFALQTRGTAAINIDLLADQFR